jgi:hypothetical protein
VPPEKRVHPAKLLPGRIHLIEDDQKIDVRLGMCVTSHPRTEEQDLPQPIAVQPAQVLRDLAGELARVERPRELGQLWIGAFGDCALGDLFVDKPLLGEPLNRSSLDPSVMKAKPRLAQLGEVEQRVL